MGLPGYTQCSMRCGSVGGLAGAATKRRAKGPHRDLPAWGKRGAAAVSAGPSLHGRWGPVEAGLHEFCMAGSCRGWGSMKFGWLTTA